MEVPWRRALNEVSKSGQPLNSIFIEHLEMTTDHLLNLLSTLPIPAPLFIVTNHKQTTPPVHLLTFSSPLPDTAIPLIRSTFAHKEIWPLATRKKKIPAFIKPPAPRVGDIYSGPVAAVCVTHVGVL
eukprot:TRINITY_DN10366_c0_g1_i2.p1 TRINITY_DN10366_c0_g1~~TRINITY_DN10366_c0_g1_i2.p1  ORF type:complete len:134 (+),score=19.34 TRINITY_DN10366_c0_g1_i2:22-402(+)